MEQKYDNDFFQKIDVEKIMEVSAKIADNQRYISELLHSMQRPDVNHEGIAAVVQEKISENLKIMKEYSELWPEMDFDINDYKKYISGGDDNV
tara:strand:+ start:145 stop:423 length:279 start_codon:yes stop_codon:yes gene_type:complete